MKDPDTRVLAVMIGRVNPVTKAHLHILETAARAANDVLLLVGSAYRPRSFRNPLSFDERKALVRKVVTGLEARLDILPLIDTLYSDRAWAANVRMAVKAYIRARGWEEEAVKVLLTGFEKDKSSRYLKWFPEWEALPVEPLKHAGRVINATDLRRALLLDNATGDLVETFGAASVAAFQGWIDANPEAVRTVRAEATYIQRYRAGTEAAEKVFGYPIPINTADAVVVQSGHVLMVRRGVQPGKGTLALPGGHLNRDETAEQAAIRELREETRLDVPPGLLANRIRARQVFDHPERSERGWVRTEAFLFQLEDRNPMEKVKGADDADKALWMPLDQVTPDGIFEDHFDILQHFIPEVAVSYGSILMAQLQAL
ncbi:NUDIX domain-containing protein [Tropicibacter sp. S64]|uniref:NUDIX domain-containing protein n=1 Tax=Tropicibacter sp. S64 TaxID=3415122 RepID=UPI003C7A0DAC